MNMSMSLSSTRAPIPYAALHANKLPAANIQTPASRTRREIAGDPPAAGLPWTRLPNRERDRVLAAEAQLAERIAAAEDEGYTLVEVPPDSRLGPAMRLYQHLLNRPLLQQWIAGQGLATTGELWECYITGPEIGSDPSAWRTELYLPLSGESA